MAGTIVTDRIESDASYASSINIASPLVIANTISMTNGAITGNLNIDSNTVFVNQVNNRVGIGTGTPLEVLHVNGAVHSTLNALNFNQTGAHFDYNAGSARISSYLSTGSSIEFLTTPSGSTTRTQARIGPTGIFTAPYQPAFQAILNGNVTNPGGGATRLTSWNKVSNTIINNRDSGFNTSTGRFTAPVDGLYLMGVHIDLSGGLSTGYYFSIGINGGNRNYDMVEDMTIATNGGFFATRIIPMAQNDYAEIYMLGGTWTLNGGGNQWNTRWEGFMVN